VVGDAWEEPDSAFLDPSTWITENAVFTDKEMRVKDTVDSAFSKAKTFLTRF
jgi:hypothetical protein